MPHSKGDDTRSSKELAVLRAGDPMIQFREQLDQLDPARLASVEADVEIRIQAAVDAALQAPFQLTDSLERLPR